MPIMNPRRSGVALIIVLGLVAILMIVSVTFTIHMRVERAGAANLRHAVIARQVVKGGLAAALMAIDKQAGESAVPEWHDPGDVTSLTYEAFPVPKKDGKKVVQGYLWRDTFISFDTNDTYNVTVPSGGGASGTVSAQIFSKEVERYFPAGLAYRGYATGYNHPDSGWRSIIQPQWQPVFSAVDNANVMGRYAFFALDTSCLLDVSCLTNSANARWMGRYPSEIDLSMPNQKRGFLSWEDGNGHKDGGVLKAQDFSDKNTDNGTYETLAEFETFVNPDPDNPTVVKDNVYFNTLSYDPGPTNRDDLVFIGGDADHIRKHKARIMKAFYDCGLTASSWGNHTPKKVSDASCDKCGTGPYTLPQSCNSEQARWAYLGLVDYVDKDCAMEPDDEIEPAQRPVTERMPMLSGFCSELTIKARQTCTKSGENNWNTDTAPVQVKISAKVKVPFVFPFIPESLTSDDKANLELEAKAAMEVNGIGGDVKVPPRVRPTDADECVVTGIQFDEGDDGWIALEGESVDEKLELPGVKATLRVGGATYRNGIRQHSFPVREDRYDDFEEGDIGMIVVYNPKAEGVKFDQQAAGSPPVGEDVETWERTWETNVFVWAEIVDPRFACYSMAKHASIDEGIMLACCKASHGVNGSGDHGVPISKIKQLDAFGGFTAPQIIPTKSSSTWFGNENEGYGNYFEGDYSPIAGASPFASYLLKHPRAVVDLYGMPMDGIQEGTDEANTDGAWSKFRMYVRNGALESVGELGYLPVGMWQTIRLYDYCDDFGEHKSTDTPEDLYVFNELPKDRGRPKKNNNDLAPFHGYFHPVLDYFTVVPADEFVQGRVNINSLNKEILAVAFHNMPVMTEFGRGYTGPERIDRVKSGEKPLPTELPSYQWLAESIIQYRSKVKRGFLKLSELGYLFGVGDVTYPLLYGAANEDLCYPALAVQKAVNPNNKPNQDTDFPWGEWEREAIIRNSCGLFTMRGQTFIVVVRGESYSAPFGRKTSMKGGTSNSSKTAIATVWRDSMPDEDGNHPMFVQFFKIIDD